MQFAFGTFLVLRSLSDPSFDGVAFERGEDIDVFLNEPNGTQRLWHYQVKTEHITTGSLCSIVDRFCERFATNIADGVVAHFSVALARGSGGVISLGRRLTVFRSTAYPQGGEDRTETSTRADMRRNLVEIGISQPTDFHLDRLSVEEIGHSPDILRDQAISALAKLHGFASFTHPELDYVASYLENEFRIRGRRRWTRVDIKVLLDAGRVSAREGPARSTGDILLIAHSSFAAIHHDYGSIPLPAAHTERRRILSVVDCVGLVGDGSSRTSTESAADRSVAEIRRALASAPEAPVLYYGFPHVPLGVLAGAVIGSTRIVHTLEHDRDAEEFAWPALEVTLDEPRPTTTKDCGSWARLRVAVSAPVRGEVALAARGEGVYGLDLHIALDNPHRGAVRSEFDARLIVRAIRRSLDEHVAGREYSALHVFAAVPVSVAVHLGRALIATGYPPVFVYNFRDDAQPPYQWRVNLGEAMAGRPSVEIMAS